MNLLLRYLRGWSHGERIVSSPDEGFPEHTVQPKREEPLEDARKGIVDDKVNGIGEKASPVSKAQTQHRHICFICGIPHSHRQSLTRHCKMHIRNGDFERPFLCLGCLGQGVRYSWTSTSPSAWSNHVERVHGKSHAPNFPSHPALVEEEQQLRCSICGGSFSGGRGVTRHFRLIHAQKEAMFKQSFPCPECLRQGKKDDIWIDGFSQLQDHVVSSHGEFEVPSLTMDSATLPNRPQQMSCGRKRKRGKEEDIDYTFIVKLRIFRL
jgi:hypothetical protein